MSLPSRSGAMGSSEVLSSNIEYYSLFTTLDLRAQPIIMNNPVPLNGVGQNVLENYGAPSISGAGWIFKFAFEREGVHTIDTLKDELNGIVLNGGTIDTKSSVNMEFTKQDLL